VLVIDKVPRKHAQFTQDWIKAKVVELCRKHHARLLNPLDDIYFEEDEMEVKNSEGVVEKMPSYRIVVLLDGWDHLHPLPEMEEYCKQQGRLFHGFQSVSSKEYRELVDLLDSDSDEETDRLKAEAAEKKRKEEEELKKKEEEIKPTEWGCEICTFANPMSDASCGICGQGKRPSMEALMASIRAAAKANQSAEEEGVQPLRPEADSEAVTNEESLRLKFLSHDLRQFIKSEQKRLHKLQEEDRLEKLRLQKEKEKALGQEKKPKPSGEPSLVTHKIESVPENEKIYFKAPSGQSLKVLRATYAPKSNSFQAEF
jgi:rubrerythrin